MSDQPAVYRMTVAYDGTQFAGWQVQPGERTVQGVLDAVLQQILQRPVHVTGAGRTDAGVHAGGMTVHFQLTGAQPDLPALERSLNALLPADVGVRELQQAAADFHARFSARERAYRYQLSTTRRVIGRQYWWEAPYTLSLDALQAGARFLPGRHDFSVFASGLEPGISPVCTVVSAAWTPVEEGLVFDIRADRFLRKMVRGIVGTLVDVGRGRLAPGDIADILDTGNRRKVGGLAPPHGLCLMEVCY